VVTKPNQLENLGLVCALIACLTLSTLNLEVPFAQWSLGAGGVFAAISIVRGKEMPSYVFLMLASLIAIQLIAPTPEIKMFILAFSVCAAVILCLPSWKNSLASQLGAISLGVYVLHHGVGVVLEELSLDLPPLEMALLVILGSSMLALAFKSIPRLGKVI